MEFGDDAIIVQTIDPGIVPNHDYYGSIKFKSGLEYTTRDARFEICDGYLTFFQKDIKTNDWILLSAIYKSPSDTSHNLNLFRDFNGGSNIDTYTDELMIIDLTASFSDSIPTKEWLDTNLMYFDGTANIKTIESGDQAKFKVVNENGSIRCNNGGVGSIDSDGTVTITGTNVNTTCVIE